MLLNQVSPSLAPEESYTLASCALLVLLTTSYKRSPNFYLPCQTVHSLEVGMSVCLDITSSVSRTR